MIAKLNVYDSENEWLEARKGKFTSSKIHMLMADPTRMELADGEILSKGAKSYIVQLLCEKLGAESTHYESAAMRWGNECEGAAALRIAELFDIDVNSDEFIYTSEGGRVFYSNEKLGGTPDIILPEKKIIVEIKAPESHNFIHYFFLEKEKVESDINLQKKEFGSWFWQCQCNMLLTGYDTTCLAIYDPRLNIPVENQLITFKIQADLASQELILNKVEEAHKLLKELEISILT